MRIQKIIYINNHIIEADMRDKDLAEIKELLQKIAHKLDEKEERPEKKPYRGGVISRNKVEQVWEALPVNPAFAMTIQEIADFVRLTPPVVQRALYILLTEGRAERKSRAGKVGKVSWEYYKLNIPSAESDEAEDRRFDIDLLRNAIPKTEAAAMSVREIANAIDSSPITIRQKIKVMEAAGEVKAVSGFNENRQPVTKYYR